MKVTHKHGIGSTWRLTNQKDNPGTLRLVVCNLKIQNGAPYYDLMVAGDTRRFPVYLDRKIFPLHECCYGDTFEVEEAWFNNREDLKKGWTNGD